MISEARGHIEVRDCLLLASQRLFFRGQQTAATLHARPRPPADAWIGDASLHCFLAAAEIIGHELNC